MIGGGDSIVDKLLMIVFYLYLRLILRRYSYEKNNKNVNI